MKLTIIVLLVLALSSFLALKQPIKRLWALVLDRTSIMTVKAQIRLKVNTGKPLNSWKNLVDHDTVKNRLKS